MEKSSGEPITWLYSINAMANKAIKDEELSKQHKKLLKWVKKNVSALRDEMSAKTEEEAEMKLKLEVALSRMISIEKLVLSLGLVMCIPTDKQDDEDPIEELSEEIEDLKQCFSNMHLEAIGGKKAKKYAEER